MEVFSRYEDVTKDRNTSGHLVRTANGAPMHEVCILHRMRTVRVKRKKEADTGIIVKQK